MSAKRIERKTSDLQSLDHKGLVAIAIALSAIFAIGIVTN